MDRAAFALVRGFITEARGSGVLVLAVGFLVLLASAIWLYAAVDGASRYSRRVLEAQNSSNSVMIAVLDQETGVRGLLLTHQIRYLVPYIEARRTLPSNFVSLRAALRALDAPALEAILDREISEYSRWHDSVAAPLLAKPDRVDAARLQEHGKTLVDQIRSDTERLDGAIDTAADEADRASRKALFRIAVVTGVLGTTFLLAYLLFSAQRSRILNETVQQRQLYENEKRIADALQAAFVQKELPVIPNLGFHASYVPAGAEELPTGRILFSIGDVAGHGIEAAVIMSRARQAIISNALHESDPSTVLRKANETILLQEPKMVTAICGYIDPANLQITYATAGHPPPILAFRDGDPYFLEHDGLPLGIFPNVAYRSFTTHARAGALLVMYTDGVIEHKRDIVDGERRLLAASRSVARAGASDPAASLQAAIFAGKLPVDDVAIMTVSFAVRAEASTATVNAFALNRLAVRSDTPRVERCAQPASARALSASTTS
jgi:CHASE3 domain sensor protein